MRTPMKRSKLRLIFLTPAIAGLYSGTLAAQTPCAVPAGIVADIGIQCSNCVIDTNDPHNARFATEPRITRVTPGTSAADVLQPGDVIVSVNGSLITTSEGAYKFSTLKPNQRVVFFVRRAGENVLTRFTTSDKCFSHQVVPAEPARAEAARTPPRMGGRIPTPAPPGRAPGTTAAGRGRGVGPVALPALAQQPRANFGISFSCSDCIQYRRSRDSEAPLVWEFQSSPEVYSVEVDGPAYRAGLRRGDLITHIDGIRITEEEAGRRFGSIEPGETIRFTYRRGNLNRTVTVKAEPRAGFARSMESHAAVRRARELIEEISRREQSEQSLLAQALERLRETDERQTMETFNRFLREQQAQYRRLIEATAELAQAENRLRRETVTPTPAPRTRPGAVTATTAPANRTIRYSGRLGTTDIEVRGGNVVVNETADEIIITTGEATIRLKKRNGG
jgi:hypothetical protein